MSPRTIERDLAALRSAGVPLYSEPGRRGGTVSLEELGDVVVTLSPDEAAALLVATVAAGPSMPFADAGSSAVKRILDALPAATREATERLRDRTRTREEPAAAAGRRVRRTIESALRRELVVNIRYRDREGRVTERGVDAVGFLRRVGGWYLIG